MTASGERGAQRGSEAVVGSASVPVPGSVAVSEPVRRSAPDNVVAVVLTYRRRRLAGDVVRSLIEAEGFDPKRIIVVVNGDGGLDDPSLEERVQMHRLPENVGPGSGFGHGLRAAFADPAVDWAYLCEDDVGLFDLPRPRLSDVLERTAAASHDAGDGRDGRADGHTNHGIGAVVSYGRVFTHHGGHTENLVPEPGSPHGLAAVDAACWGATLVSRAVVAAGIVPDPQWFFGYEDFDFFCRVRAGGFSVMVDAVAARAVADQQTSRGRAEALGSDRPVDADEAWRAYYVARNFFGFARRHGRPSWLVWHLAYSVRRLQLARGKGERAAYVRGLWDGFRGRMGRNERYVSHQGELPLPGVRPR